LRIFGGVQVAGAVDADAPGEGGVVRFERGDAGRERIEV
jgi:hypothetical protein